jgi:predicted AlkP superfamily phosphohydrolase/phosphomutase
MRVLILGIDALEYSLVEEWDLKFLKQKEYGKTIVPLTKTNVGSHPATVVVWSCFITGKQPKEMGYETIKISKRDKLDDLYWTVKTRFPKSEMIFKYFHRKSRSTKPTRKDIKAPTLFDNKKINSIHLHVPVYDNDAFPEYRGVGTVRAVSDKYYRKIYEKGCKEEFQERTEEVYRLLDKDWDVAMQYFFLLDGIQHVFFRNKLKIMDYYMKFNMFVSELTKKLNDNVVVLIISDHGQKKGVHTDYGFYSSNIKLGLKNPKINDFKDLIEKIVDKNI